MTSADPDRTCFEVAANIIEQTTALLVEPGLAGLEGSAVWIGIVTPKVASVTRVYRPEQVSVATEMGLAVEVTEAGLSALITSLDGDEAVIARLHTHGTADVGHSPVDDANVLVSHPGAVSIVVPWFAINGIQLPRCGVHILAHDHRWRRLSNDEIRRRFRFT